MLALLVLVCSGDGGATKYNPDLQSSGCPACCLGRVPSPSPALTLPVYFGGGVSTKYNPHSLLLGCRSCCHPRTPAPTPGPAAGPASLLLLLAVVVAPAALSSLVC